MKLKKSLLLLLLAAFCCFLPVGAAAADGQPVFDEAGLFRAEEITSLEDECKRLSEKWNFDFVIATTDDAEGKTAQAYADDFYDTGGFGRGSDKSGLLFLIDLDNREAYISTAGAAIDLYTDSRIEQMLDDVVFYLPDEEYYHAAAAFLESADAFARQGVPKKHYRYDAETGRILRTYSLSWGNFVIAGAAALAVSLTFAALLYARYNRNAKAAPYPFRQQSKMELVQSEDHFLNKTVVTRRINTSSGGGGGSSVHTSSGGRSHGGGGRKF